MILRENPVRQLISEIKARLRRDDTLNNLWKRELDLPLRIVRLIFLHLSAMKRRFMKQINVNPCYIHAELNKCGI